MKTKIAIASYLKDLLREEKKWLVILGLVFYFAWFPESIIISKETLLLPLFAVRMIAQYKKAEE